MNSDGNSIVSLPLGQRRPVCLADLLRRFISIADLGSLRHMVTLFARKQRCPEQSTAINQRSVCAAPSPDVSISREAPITLDFDWRPRVCSARPGLHIAHDTTTTSRVDQFASDFQPEFPIVVSPLIGVLSASEHRTV